MQWLICQHVKQQPSQKNTHRHDPNLNPHCLAQDFRTEWSVPDRQLHPRSLRQNGECCHPLSAKDMGASGLLSENHLIHFWNTSVLSMYFCSKRMSQLDFRNYEARNRAPFGPQPTRRRTCPDLWKRQVFGLHLPIASSSIFRFYVRRDGVPWRKPNRPSRDSLRSTSKSMFFPNNMWSSKLHTYCLLFLSGLLGRG